MKVEEFEKIRLNVEKYMTTIRGVITPYSIELRYMDPDTHEKYYLQLDERDNINPCFSRWENCVRRMTDYVYQEKMKEEKEDDISKINFMKPINTEYHGVIKLKGNEYLWFKQVLGIDVRPQITKVIFSNDEITKVFWDDKTYTIVKVQDSDTFNPEKGIMECIYRKMTNNKNKLFDRINSNINLYSDIYDPIHLHEVLVIEYCMYYFNTHNFQNKLVDIINNKSKIVHNEKKKKKVTKRKAKKK